MRYNSMIKCEKFQKIAVDYVKIFDYFYKMVVLL